MSLAISIYNTSRNATLEHGGGRLESVKVAIGELSAIDPELLSFSWESVVSDTPDADAKLEVEWRPARQYCINCQQEKPRHDNHWSLECPDCGTALRVEGGMELDVLQIELITDPDNGK